MRSGIPLLRVRGALFTFKFKMQGVIYLKPFMDADFLLSTETARRLYHEYAEGMPIVDYHCHVSPKEIWEDRKFNDLFEAWLEGDHYKWRLMRSNGVEEKYITGSASHREKFQKFAEALPRAIGNPMYHWCHLELRTYFGYEGVLSGDTAQEVWDLCSEKLKASDMGARGIIAKSNVAFVGTTDDPTDSLEWHAKIAADPSIKTVVAPSFRPDKALNIEKPGWAEYADSLSRAAGIPVDSLEGMKKALKARMDHFDKNGCRASDHGLDYVPFRPASPESLEGIFQKGIKGETVSAEEAESFKTELLLFCAQEYARMGWVMQIHYNCMRNPNSAMFARLGPDTGFDCMNNVNCSGALYALLDALSKTEQLPRTILYSLNPGEDELIDTMIGAFQGSEVPGKLQHGSGWWFNDTKSGMTHQMTSLANLGILGNFVGMLTDSRSFLSYTRHAYFRRILCDLIGKWVENGEYPNDMSVLGGLVQDICCNNAKRYLGLEN